MLPLIAFGAGIYLGLHFNILVLLPFSILGAGAFVFASLSSGQSFFDSASFLLVPWIVVQAGFMLGLMGRGIYETLLVRLNIGKYRRSSDLESLTDRLRASRSREAERGSSFAP